MPASQTAGDLGRRVTEQRHRAGLSRAAAARRAGMAPGYLEYLETSPAPDPGPGTLARLAAALGTTAGALAERGPVAIPVNYRMLGEDIVFRTRRTAGAAAGAQLSRVSFDVDHIDDALGEGWSVLVSGDARLVTGAAELERVAALGISPWAGGERDIYVRLTPREVTGRRIRASE